MTEPTGFAEHLRTIAQLRDEMLARTNQQTPEPTGAPIIVKLDETKLPHRTAPAAEVAELNDLIRQGRTLKLSHEPRSEAGATSVIEALVYHIPAAKTIEVYMPTIRWCTPIHLHTTGIPTRDELLATAQEMADRHFARLGHPQPPARVRLAFRVPNEGEMQEPAPPTLAGRVGYGVYGFGHIDPGYIRSTKPRPPGSEPVPCPSSWFPSAQ
ncbi:Uncharacterised protein [Mycobacteroides abscessus subsp. abscessus]|uniref:hypothetical protein n=1 Tax=Mycobacteroides abscessus TaxID=36809 RepID=UPI0009285E8D|nr:hypothetical protein [Mycobacteroides abscessus]SHU69405.1 Uncharacterised protein [Mycobacteroides abscessus subsp. abscessus]